MGSFPGRVKSEVSSKEILNDEDRYFDLGFEPISSKRMDFEKVESLIDKGNLKETIRVLNLNISSDKQNERLVYCRGVCFLYLGEFESALEDFCEVLKTYPKSAFCLFRRGQVFQHMEKYIDALKDYTDASRSYPKEPLIFLERGKLYYERSDYNRALIDFELVVKLDHENQEGILMRGIVNHAKKEFREALKDYERLVKLDSQNYHYYKVRSIGFNDVDEMDKAIRDIKTSISLNPTFAELHERGAEYHLIDGNLKESMLYINKAIELNPGNLLNFLFRGELFLRLKRPRLAMNDCDFVIKCNPSFSPSLYEMRAKCYKILNMDDKKMSYDKEMAISMSPQCDILELRSRFDCYSNEEIRKMIEKVSEKILKDKDNFRLFSNRAMYYSWWKGRENDAIRDWSIAISLNPDDFRDRINRSVFLYELGNY